MQDNTITRLNVRTMPLKIHAIKRGINLRSVALPNEDAAMSQASGILRMIKEREAAPISQKSAVLDAEKSQRLISIQEEANRLYNEYTGALNTSSAVFKSIAILQESATAAVEDKPKKKLRRLKERLQEAVFDYSELEQEKIEEEVDQLINQDGYYNEVLPVDYDEEYKEDKVVSGLLLTLLGVLFGLFVILYFLAF